MYVLFIPIVWFTFQYNVMHYTQFFQELYLVLALSVSKCLIMPHATLVVNMFVSPGAF